MGIATYFTPYLPAFLAAGTLIVWVAIWWAAMLPRLALGLLMVSLIIGQLVRIPLPGQGGGFLVSDIATVVVLITASAIVIRNRGKVGKNKKFLNIFVACAVLFIIWSLFTLLLRVQDIGVGGSLIAASYWVRLSTHLMLIPALLVMCEDEGIRRFLNKALLLTIAALTLIGLLQIAALPNVQDLPHLISSAGWDPHESRLVSTWLDPNFFGAFLAISIPFISIQNMAGRKKTILLTLTIAALLFTKSRSALAAMAIAGVVFIPLVIIVSGHYVRHKKRLITYVALLAPWLIAALIFALVLLGSRASGFWQYDPTVNLRLVSLAAAWKELAQSNIGVGVGYNAYQFAAQKAGLVSNYSIHSRAGADNSFLTLLITTGLPGLILFLIPWVAIMHKLFQKTIILLRRTGSLQSALQLLAAAASVLILFIHAQVVNSFLYSHLLITLPIIVALAISRTINTHEAV